MSDLLDFIRDLVLAYPEAYEESPWGEPAAKVRKKMFAMYGAKDGQVWLTVKLPLSREAALTRDDTTPTGYGLGRSGWVSARFTDPDAVDRAMIEGWLEESYRTIAPRTLAARVPEGGPVPIERVPLAPLPDNAPLVVVLSDDPLRAERAVRGLASRGFDSVSATTHEVDTLIDLPAVAVLADLGRSPAVAAERAGELQALHFDGLLVLAGIRDAANEREVKAALPDAALYSRQPPGDPGVLDQLAAALR